MRIGYSIDTFRGWPGAPLPDAKTAVATMEAMIAEGIAAERAGFHSVRVPDRHGRTDCFFPSALQLLTILSRETSKVAIGAFALVNTLYPPMLIAEECALIDNLSHGPAVHGLGPGQGVLEHLWHSAAATVGRFLENVAVIEKAYVGERFSYHGEFYDVEDALLSPQPFQSPRFPFWGAGQSRPRSSDARPTRRPGRATVCPSSPSTGSGRPGRIGRPQRRGASDHSW